jgi:hypothetical protein
MDVRLPEMLEHLQKHAVRDIPGIRRIPEHPQGGVEDRFW